MKLTKSILLCAAFASTSFFVSCDDKKDSETSGSDGAAAVAEKKDTPDTLTDEMIVQFHALGDALVSAKDKASAEASVKQIEGVGDAMAAIATRMDKLETPSDEEKLALDAKMDKVQEGMEAKMGEAMKSLMANEEVAKIIGPAMQKFGERMSEHDKVFERFGKKK